MLCCTCHRIFPSLSFDFLLISIYDMQYFFYHWFSMGILIADYVCIPVVMRFYREQTSDYENDAYYNASPYSKVLFI